MAPGSEISRQGLWKSPRAAILDDLSRELAYAEGDGVHGGGAAEPQHKGAADRGCSHRGHLCGRATPAGRLPAGAPPAAPLKCRQETPAPFCCSSQVPGFTIADGRF